jgi:hypothetical protein
MKKYSSLIKIISISVFLVAFRGISSADQSGLKIPDQVTGDLAYGHVYFLSEEIGARVAGTTEEEAAADYIIEQFEGMGYYVEVQEFEYERGGTTYSSQNIIATKTGKIDQTVIIGAHYDSVSERSCPDGNVLTGAGDNASGVGALLEVAEVLANYKTLGNIKYVAFGAEEKGLIGSVYYANQMTEKEILNTAAMINLDSVGVGDHFNVYSGIDNPGWARDLALKIGERMGHDIRTSPGDPSCDFLAWGEAGDWSDHVAFRHLGIPIAYFEMMNWEIEPCEGEETEDYGWIMHTCMDNLSMVSHEKLEMTAEVVAALAFQMSKTKLPKSAKGKVAKGNKFIVIQKRH